CGWHVQLEFIKDHPEKLKEELTPRGGCQIVLLASPKLACLCVSLPWAFAVRLLVLNVCLEEFFLDSSPGSPCRSFGSPPGKCCLETCQPELLIHLPVHHPTYDHSVTPTRREKAEMQI
ncbi:hypothetical protein ATANTOWER_024399, partial [Ataeniobius toweri]|nr:hypothetical protein [Ataeniobius toweri]